MRPPYVVRGDGPRTRPAEHTASAPARDGPGSVDVDVGVGASGGPWKAPSSGATTGPCGAGFELRPARAIWCVSTALPNARRPARIQSPHMAQLKPVFAELRRRSVDVGGLALALSANVDSGAGWGGWDYIDAAPLDADADEERVRSVALSLPAVEQPTDAR
jgi:hypothetical protein